MKLTIVYSIIDLSINNVNKDGLIVANSRSILLRNYSNNGKNCDKRLAINHSILARLANFKKLRYSDIATLEIIREIL
jgi:hypothetical protein